VSVDKSFITDKYALRLRKRFVIPIKSGFGYYELVAGNGIWQAYRQFIHYVVVPNYISEMF